MCSERSAVLRCLSFFQRFLDNSTLSSRTSSIASLPPFPKPGLSSPSRHIRPQPFDLCKFAPIVDFLRAAHWKTRREYRGRLSLRCLIFRGETRHSDNQPLFFCPCCALKLQASTPQDLLIRLHLAIITLILHILMFINSIGKFAQGRELALQARSW